MQIEANGIKMNYELSGRRDAGVVALSHSLGSSLVMWNPQMEMLKARFRVLRYDTRGHGGSDAPKGPYTLELLGEDVVGLLDGLGIDQVHFVGLSMGGMIGQYLALAHPNRLHSVVLCDTSAVVPEQGQPAIQERIDTARGKGMKALVDPTIERWFTPSFIRLAPSGLQDIRKQFLATPVEGYVGCSEAIRRLNYLDRLSGVRLPALIIVGEEDPGTPVSAAEAIHQRIKDSRLVILPSARHLSNVEQPEAFNNALLDFLGSVRIL
jgi:3-oxoadipate enol-lactonase